MRPAHPQVPFKTMDGEMVTVDEGLERTLVLLRDLGIKTTYSCQNNYGAAYILMPFMSGLRFQRLLRGTTIGKIFKSGKARLEFSLFRDDGRDQFFQTKFSVRRSRYGAFRTDYLISNKYGWRISYRWPDGATSILQSTLESLNQKDKP